MIWFTLALFAASFVLSNLLAPKPQLEDARPGKLGDIRFPRVNEGDPVPGIFGKVRLRAPSCIWYGHFTSKAQKKNVKTGLFSSKDVVTGYKYWVGFDLALCCGPGVHLHKIWCEKKTLFTYPGAGLTGPNDVTIDKPGLFGGKDRGGGFVGTARFYDGDFDQEVNTYLQNRLGSDVPGYNGICHIVFQHPYIGMSANLRPLSFELSRYPNNLGLAAGIIDVGDDINPMEVIYDILTEGWAFCDVDSGDIDTTNFQLLASTLASEGNGMSIAVQSRSVARDVVEEVLRQIDGVLYQDPETGKITGKLIRDDYVIGDLPVFDESNVRDIRSFSRSSWGETKNVVRVVYTNRDRNYEDGAALFQDMANINMQGGIKSATFNFPGCMTDALALQLAAREGSQIGVPLFQSQLEINREAATLRPGSPFVLNWTEYNGLSQLVMRVQKYDLGELVNGRVVIDVTQDKFGVSSTVFSIEDSGWTEEDRTAVDITDYLLFEAPYWILQRIEDLTIFDDSCWLWLVARRPDYMEGYNFITSEDSFTNEETYDLNAVPFPNTAELHEAVYFNQGQEEGLLSKVVIRSLDPDDGSFLKNTDINGIRDDGENMIVINGEIMCYTTFADNGDGTYDLQDVRRALLDTQFEDHADGDIVYFLDGIDQLSENSHPDSGLVIQYYLLSFSDQDEQEIPDGVFFAITPNQRYDRPHPPDRVTVDGLRAPIEIINETTLTISWRERDRANEQNRLVSDSTDTPEVGTTYKVRFLMDDVEQQEVTGVSAPPQDLTGCFGHGAGRVEVDSNRGGLDSWTSDFVEFFFALYLNLSTELLTNGGFETGSTSGWTVESGSWSVVSTDYPMEPIDTDMALSTSATSELSQIIDIVSPTDYRGKPAIVRAYRGAESSSAACQMIVELLDAVSAVLDSVITPLEVLPTVGQWNRLEVPVPLRTDAVELRVRLIAANADCVFDGCTVKVNTAAPTSAVEYDTVSGVTVTGAWGLRLMVSGYSGPLVRVRDTETDVEQDIYADPDGNLSPFFVKGQARVVTLYDQSGNGADLEPAAVSEQPRLNWQQTETGRPSIEFEGDTDSLLDTVAATNRPYMTARPNCCVAFGPKRDTSVDYIFTIPQEDAAHTSPFARWGLVTTATEWEHILNGSFTGTSGNGDSNSGKNVWFMDYQQGAVYHNEDTTADDTWTPADVTYPNNTRIRFAETPIGSQEWDGHFHELCIFTGTISAGDRQTIMESVSEYWFNFTA